MQYYHDDIWSKPGFSRYGALWTPEEKDKLFIEITNGKNVENIAKEHQRTTGEIIIITIHIALEMINNGISLEEASSIVKMDPTVIKVFKDKADKKN
jgi:hypothetical protein